MTKAEFESMLVEVLKSGVTLSVFMKNGVVWYDMNTGMKSHLHIALIDGVGKFESRYGDGGEISDLDDLIGQVRSCACGRDYMNSEWTTLLGAIR